MEQVEKKLIDSIENEALKNKVESFFAVDVKKYLSDLKTIEQENKDILGVDPVCLQRVIELDDYIVRKGEGLCSGIDNKILVKNIRKVFREIYGEKSFFRSEIVRKGFIKPRGYPGDFEMMNYIYNNVIVTKDFGRYFERDFLNKGYAEAVRDRKNKMVEVLKKTTDEFRGRNFRILNLPCGPARDVQEFVNLSGIRKDINIEIVCVDQDKGALDFAQGMIKNLPANIKIEFRQGDILNYIRRPEEHIRELGKFDFVYSIGIADYLPDKLLKNMLSFSWQLLGDRGFITYAFKIEDKDPFAPIPPKWFCDWIFVPRNTLGAVELVKSGISGNSCMEKEDWEKSGRIVFLTAKKVDVKC